MARLHLLLLEAFDCLTRSAEFQQPVVWGHLHQAEHGPAPKLARPELVPVRVTRPGRQLKLEHVPARAPKPRLAHSADRPEQRSHCLL